MTVVARRPLFRVLHQLLAVAILALALPAHSVDQVGGGPIPHQVPGMSCASNASNCINSNEKLEGGEGDIDAVETATISQETFTPLCELTFKVVARGADYRNTFGWYAVKRDDEGEPIAPELSDLHVFLDCGDVVGTEKTLMLPKDVGEIGFFLANKGNSCVAKVDPPDPLGATLAEQPTNLFFSQRAFNSDSVPNSDGKIHLLVWQSRANPNAFYFGWEDQNGTTADNDFEDLMTYVTGIQCAGGGDACEVEGEQGVCADGVTQCRDGELQCVATQGKGTEACNGLDDDCDGDTDEGDDLCDPGDICVKGRCQPPCGTGEFRCKQGEMCVQGVCLETSCAEVDCDAGEVCRDGECVAACAGVVCPYGAACRAGVCVDVCEGVECDAGFVCEVRESSEGGTFVGVCSSCDCRGCGDGKSCVDHLCVENACKDQTCDEGTRCVAGECVDNCADAKCPAGQICEAGGCIADPDGGGNGAGGAGDGSGGEDGGGIIIEPGGPGSGGSGNGPDDGGVGGSSNYVEAKGCSCETPGTARSSAASLALLGLLLSAGVARARRKRG